MEIIQTPFFLYAFINNRSILFNNYVILSAIQRFMNKETQRFISDNIDTDIHQLALQSIRYPLVDMPLAIRQINGKQKIKSKVPLFFNTDDILYPAQLSLEQSSSESTAKYKSSLCEGNRLVDLTGGFGVDCCFMAEKFVQVTYVERYTDLCELARSNFKVLGRENIDVIMGDSIHYLSKIMDKVDWIYIDPARRSESGKKVVFLSDCEPNVSDLAPLLLEKSGKVMIKLSPMLDITAAVRELPTTSEIHIISVENECKEVLLLLNQLIDNHKKIKTINISKTKTAQIFEFNADEEVNTSVTFTSEISKYLYEPNAAVMKSGAFKLIGSRYKLNKLHTNTHLYTSGNLSIDFPGRVFEVQKVWINSKNELKEMVSRITKANISTRNYPLSVDELRKKLKIKEGGDTYLIACTVANEKRVIVECKRV